MKAPEEVLKARRIVKARRGEQAAAPSAASAQPVTTAGAEESADPPPEAAPARSNPFAGISLVASGGAAAAPAEAQQQAPAQVDLPPQALSAGPGSHCLALRIVWDEPRTPCPALLLQALTNSSMQPYCILSSAHPR